MLSEERLMEIQSLNAVDHHDTFRMSHTEYETYVGQLDDAVDDLLTEVDRLTATMKDMVPIDDCFLIRTDVQGATKPITCRQWMIRTDVQGATKPITCRQWRGK